MISIIVPVYNAHNTILKCIKSVISQSYGNLEIILVIDGISDVQEKCLAICESIHDQDGRVKIIVKANNGGVDYARFTGLKAAQGDFVTFLDADDWLEPNALDTMYSVMQHDSYDYVEVSSFKCLGPIRQVRHLSLAGPISSPKLFDNYYVSFFGQNYLPVSIWGKLYRRKTIENAGLYPSGFAMGEDLVFNMKLFPFLNKIYLIDKPYYNYRYGGMTSRYNPHLLKDLKAQFLLKLDAIDKFSYHKADNSTRIEMVNVLHSDIKQRLIYLGDQTRDKLVEDIRDEIDEDFWCEVLNITNGYFDNSPFYIALMNRDAESLYAICKKEVDSTRIQRACKRVASRILSII